MRNSRKQTSRNWGCLLYLFISARRNCKSGCGEKITKLIKISLITRKSTEKLHFPQTYLWFMSLRCTCSTVWITGVYNFRAEMSKIENVLERSMKSLIQSETWLYPTKYSASGSKCGLFFCFCFFFFCFIYKYILFSECNFQRDSKWNQWNKSLNGQDIWWCSG